MRAEVEMLRSAGHLVELFEADNKTIDGPVAKVAAAGSLFHSYSSSRKMAELLKNFRPNVLHIHNWFPLLSPSIISAANEARVPVVQTLHNFRMLCANGTLYRDGRICHDCLGKSLPLGAVAHACYSTSRIGSALITIAFSYHRLTHTWDGISTFIALSEFQRDLLTRGGVDAARITVKPNFVKESGEIGTGGGGYALFVGRLTPEKGIRTVLKAWAEGSIPIPLRIMGDGPLAGEVSDRASSLAQVEYIRQQPIEQVYAAMAGARFVICASECHEAFGLTIVEAFSRGTPVLAADIESTVELVKDGQTGLRFAAGDSNDLATKATLLCEDTATYRDMRRRCRNFYEERYTDKINYKLLMDIYRQASVSTHARSA
jgi:glycosyltransferase involved in cell wall biosynthesis